MDVVSEWANYCPHCGHIEPSNIDEITSDETCKIRPKYNHQSTCVLDPLEMEYTMFIALWNARTHMALNDVLLTRADESLTEAMTPFIREYLTDDSHFVIKNSHDRFWEEDPSDVSPQTQPSGIRSTMVG